MADTTAQRDAPPRADPRAWTQTAGVGLVAGLVAAIVMTLVMTLLRTVLGIAPPPELIPDRIAPLMPINLFFTLIGVFGGYNELKQFGVGSMLAGQLLVGTLFGLVYARIVQREQADSRASTVPARTLGLGAGERAVAVFVGALWILSLALLWPVLGANFRGLPQGTATIATALGLLASYASYGVGLVLTYRFMTTDNGRPTTADRHPSPSIGRRAVVVGGVGVVLALASGGLMRRLFGLATFSYDGRRYSDPSLPPITPTDQFYSVTKNVIDPSVDRPLWRLEINGLVNRAQSYRFEDLAAMTPTTQETTLMCISNGVGDGLMSNAVWKGVPLSTLLGAAGPRPGAVEVVVKGVDGYSDTFAIDKAMEPTTMVVYEMNGQPLPERHGFPARLIVPGLFGEKHVKWVTRLEVVDHDAKGFYEQQGWGPDFVVPIRTRFFAPDFAEPLRLGTPVMLKGIAFAGNLGISRVEVSADDGQSWQQARIDHPSSGTGWATWSHEWRPDRAGEYRLLVRAEDAAGRPQPAEDRGIVPDGGRGYHRVTAQVDA